MEFPIIQGPWPTKLMAEAETRLKILDEQIHDLELNLERLKLARAAVSALYDTFDQPKAIPSTPEH